jgi:leader peptidase (prepilin peptidase)/N-methyltransferase
MTVLVIKSALFSAMLITAAVWDMRKKIIPDLIPLLILLVGLICIKPIDAFLGLFLTGLPYLLAAVCLKHRDGLAVGGGDIKLMAACGFTLGIWGGILQSVLSLTLAILAGAVTAIVGHKSLKQIKIPLAPYFCAGGIFSYLVLLFSITI